jgi:signal transduction histidine kinase
LELVADLPVVLGIRIELQQVVINLMVNGIEAMVVRSSRHKSEEALILVQDSCIGSIRITWIGCSIPFSPAGGIGMGLSIRRSIIDAHGGRLWASSNTGLGATCQFALPVNT